MAKPRVFISSTYYDLKHLRSSIENFIDQLGYEAVLSEKDSIAYLPDIPLDESCYREAQNSDIFVLIIGGRYGSQASAGKEKKGGKTDFFERYESITKREYESASEREIPIYILIDASVDAEYHTFLKNKTNKNIEYAHVDSINIFHLIESIREKQKNNPIKLFSRYSEIEQWLREQWAGTFRELIQRVSAGKKINEIDNKVADLAETTETLKRYLEKLISNLNPENDEANRLIREENQRLLQAKLDAELKTFRYVQHLSDTHLIELPTIKKALLNSNSYLEFIETVFKNKGRIRVRPCANSQRAFDQVNEARNHLELPNYLVSELEYVRHKYEKKEIPDRNLRSKVKITKDEQMEITKIN